MSGLMKNNDGLREGWNIVTLNSICEINPKLDKSKFPADMEVSFVPMAAVGASNGKIDVSQKRPFYEVKKGFTPFQSGDVLFAKITPCMENGKMAIVPKLVNECGFGSTEFHVLRPNHGTDARYIYYYVSCENFRREAAHNMTGAVGQKRISASYLSEQKVPFAPIDQQKLIVSEIEKQFSRLDEAVAALKRVRAGLKRYKASVLKAAVEGKLTEEWRKQNPNVESADKLLERIKKERSLRGAERRSKLRGKEEIASSLARNDNLPELPNGWLWATVDAVCSVISGDAYKKKDYVTDGIRLFQIANVSFGKVVWDQKNYLPNKFLESFPDMELKEGDVVMALNRPILDNMLKVARLGKKDAPAILYQRVAKFNFIVNGLASYFYVFAQSPIFLKQVQRNLQGTDQPYLNTSLIPIMIIPFPPLLEQQKIVEEIESRLSVAEEIEETIGINLKRAERLRQAILKKAFSGRLV